MILYCQLQCRLHVGSYYQGTRQKDSIYYNTICWWETTYFFISTTNRFIKTVQMRLSETQWKRKEDLSWTVCTSLLRIPVFLLIKKIDFSDRKMFKNTFQSGFLSILYSIGSKPLQIWDKKVRNGHIKRITDQDIQVFSDSVLHLICCLSLFCCEPARAE